MLRIGAIVTLSFLSGQCQSFTSFHPSQSELVHAPSGHHHSPEVASRPESFREEARSPREFIRQPKDNIGSSQFLDSPGQVQRGGSLDRFPQFVQTGNLVQQTKAFVDASKDLFKFLEGNEQAQLTFDIVFETSDCLGNVEDVIDLMDETVRLVEYNAPEIIYVEALVDNLKFEKDINKQISGSAKMLRALGHIIPSLSNASSRICLSSPEDSIRSFKALAHALIAIRNHRDIIIDDIVRQHLEFSSQVMSDTATFLIQMNKVLTLSKIKCENHKMKDSVVYDTIADIMEILADFFQVLGFEDKVAAIKRQIIFVKRISRPFDDLKELADLNTSLTCDFEHGSYEELALALEDIGELIKSVGLKKLSSDLGIDFELDLIHEI